jgi:hypothetical protein
MEKFQQASNKKAAARKRLAFCNGDFFQYKTKEKTISINPENNDMPAINI